MCQTGLLPACSRLLVFRHCALYALRSHPAGSFVVCKLRVCLHCPIVCNVAADIRFRAHSTYELRYFNIADNEGEEEE